MKDNFYQPATNFIISSTIFPIQNQYVTVITTYKFLLAKDWPLENLLTDTLTTRKQVIKSGDFIIFYLFLLDLTHYWTFFLFPKTNRKFTAKNIVPFNIHSSLDMLFVLRTIKFVLLLFKVMMSRQIYEMSF